MSLFKVKTICTDKHWAEFQARAFDRRETIDSLRAWLLSLGYRISRSAVARYRKTLRGQMELDQACQAVAGVSDDVLRAMLVRSIQSLGGRDLSILAVCAAAKAGLLGGELQDLIGGRSKAG